MSNIQRQLIRILSVTFQHTLFVANLSLHPQKLATKTQMCNEPTSFTHIDVPTNKLRLIMNIVPYESK